ncbi:MAG: alpha/beta fold hydrolase [Candidatus Acidiferrales bacterium]
MTIARRFGYLLIFLAATCAVARAGGTDENPQSTKAADAPQQFAPMGDFRLQSGEVIHDFHLGYRTVGKLNKARSNAVLWPTWLGGKSEDLLSYVGPNNVVDTQQYFAILVDSIGDGVSTSPSNSASQPRLQFPKFTIRDLIEAEHALATEVFRIPHLRAVLGISMGGMQAFEWVTAYPDFMDAAVAIAGSPQTTSYDDLLWTAQIDALELDPEWDAGNGTKPMPAGYAVLNEIGSMASTSPAYRVAMTSPKDFPAFIVATRKETVGWAPSACDMIRQREAIMALDVAAEHGETLPQAARRVHARMLVVVSPEDHTVNPLPAQTMARAGGWPVITLDSSCGHQSLSCISTGALVAQFLAAPESVRSQTLAGGPNE